MIIQKNRKYFQNSRDDMLKFIPDNPQKILEFGCGEGDFSVLLKKKFHSEIWAVEIDKKSAQIASQKLDKVICADAHDSICQLPDKYFDCIICFDILEHLEDPYKLLNSLKSKLSANGVIVTSIPNIRHYTAFKNFVLKGNWDYQEQGVMDRTHLRFFTHKSIVKMFNDLEFKIKLMEGIHPTSSTTCKVFIFLTFCLFSDIKYKQFVSIVSL